MQPEDFRVVVSWTEVTRKGDHDVHLTYGKVYPVEDREAAKALYTQAKGNNGWAPDHAFDIQIDAFGPGLRPRDPSPEVRAKGLAMVRAAIAHCRGPLSQKDLEEAVA